jgi:hypothetical protein
MYLEVFLKMNYQNFPKTGAKLLEMLQKWY